MLGTLALAESPRLDKYDTYKRLQSCGENEHAGVSVGEWVVGKVSVWDEIML